MPPTEELFYLGEGDLFEFSAKIVTLFENIEDGNKKNIVVLDKTCFYPTSGGQEHDSGFLKIKGETYNITDVQKVGKSILHYVDKVVPDDAVGMEVSGKVDENRRLVLRNHHTGLSSSSNIYL